MWGCYYIKMKKEKKYYAMYEYELLLKFVYWSVCVYIYNLTRFLIVCTS